MKRVLIFLGLMIATILSGCLSEKEKEEVKALERAAKEKMETFLEDEFGDYKILECEQFVTIGFLDGNYISGITEFVVKIDDEKYNFAYNANSDTYWSDYYFDEIFDDIEDEVSNYEILNEAYNHEVNIYGNSVRVLEKKLLLHEDKNIDDVMERMQSSDEYLMECCFYFNNKNNFTPTNLGLDCIYNEYPNMKLILYNTAGGFYDPAYVLDKVIYKNSDYDDYHISVEYSHGKLVSVGGNYFKYDDNFYDVKITSIKYNVNDPERTNFPGVDFKREGAAYKIEFEKLVEVDLAENETSFINEDGIEVKVVYEDYFNLYMYLNKGEYENKYFYNSYTKKMDNIYPYDEGSYCEENFWLRDMASDNFIIAIYEEVD